jgi:aryl-alcohol dehydrogenase-like predicted oxidoreductase
MAQLAMAWTLNNRNVSTAITGCSRPEQLVDSVKAVEIYKKFTPEIEKKIEEVLKNIPDTPIDFKKWVPVKPRRP